MRSEANQRPEIGDNYAGSLSVSLPADRMRDLAQINIVKAVTAIASEWLAIIIAITLSHQFWHPFLYPIAVMFIGARQHALAVLQHDAAHYRLLPNKRWNDALGEVLLAWPILFSNQYFREYHFLHHRYIGTEKDGNRIQYGTHNSAGELTPAWQFPKQKIALVFWFLLRISGVAGAIYLARSSHRILTQGSISYRLINLFYYAAILGIIFLFNCSQLFLIYWIIPLCTWFAGTNLLRIAGEHSAIDRPDNFYQLTRTTVPSWFDRILIVPRNISYHLEHHIYPQVPFYKLPELHDCLMAQSSYCQNSQITRGYGRVFQELTGDRY
jgi:fatty acid desaturase